MCAVAACGGSSSDGATDDGAAADSSGESGELTVVTTVAPITSITANIVGDRAQVVGIVPEGTNSHTFEPPPSAALVLSDADVVFINGLQLEEPTKELANANLGEGVPLVELGDRTIQPDQYKYDFSFPESEGKPNPHLWTDPTLVKVYADIILDTVGCGIAAWRDDRDKAEIARGLELRLQDRVAILDRSEFALRRGEVDRRGHDVEIRPRMLDRLPEADLRIEQQFVDAFAAGRGIDPQMKREMPLRVEIDEQDPVPRFPERGPEVHRRGRLAGPALLIEERDDSRGKSRRVPLGLLPGFIHGASISGVAACSGEGGPVGIGEEGHAERSTTIVGGSWRQGGRLGPSSEISVRPSASSSRRASPTPVAGARTPTSPSASHASGSSIRHRQRSG